MAPEPFLEALLALPALHDSAISPDGQWLAWTWYNAGPFADVYAAPCDGATPPIRLTDSEQDTTLVSWSPDSKAVLVAQDHDGDEHEQLFRVDLERPLQMQPLTEASPPYYLRGGQLHPNGRWLIYSANVDAASGTVIEPSRVYRHDVVTGERRVLARPERPGWTKPRLNVQGSHILYQRSDLHPAGDQVWLVDIEGTRDHEIINAGADRKASATWLADGVGALVLAEADGYRRVGRWSLAGANVDWLIDDPARNVEAVFAPPSAQQAVVLDVQGARTHAVLLDPDTGDLRALPSVPGDLVPIASCTDGAWIGQFSNAQQPADLVRFDPEDAAPATFASLTRIWERTALRGSDLAPAEDFSWRSVDDLEIHGWLYRAGGQARGTIVHVHGGPTGHSRDALNPEIQLFVASGFNVLDPNYRGSTGFGSAFQEAIKEDGWGGREQEDIRTGIEALIAVGIAQPGKVGITGTSYGGYSSWCAITRYPRTLIAAAAPICGMTDLVVDYQTTRPDLRPYSEEMIGGTPDQMPDRYRERSPIHFVRNIRGRLLIVQGMRDPNVTPENLAVVRTALDVAGIAYQVLAFEDEGHGIRLPKNQKTLYLRLVQFFGDAFAASA